MECVGDLGTSLGSAGQARSMSSDWPWRSGSMVTSLRTLTYSTKPFHDLSDDIDIVWTVVRWVPYEDRTRLCDLVLAR